MNKNDEALTQIIICVSVFIFLILMRRRRRGDEEK